MHVQTKELPQAIISALKSVGYNRPDIKIETRETISAFCAGQDGMRAFVVTVNLSTGERKESFGSWGGSNMFNPTNQVDLDSRQFELVPGFVVIKGSGGGHGCFATIYANPATVAPMLPSADAQELTPDQKEVLRVYRTIRSGCRGEYLTGAYRGSYGSYCNDLTQKRVDDALAELSRMGFIKINKAGAASVTTAGKNVNLKGA